MDSIRVTNLRSLEDTGEVKLKPLVVLLGKNSSGKSTFLRTFPLLKQSIVTPITEPILWYSEKSVDFGDFETSINKKVKSKDTPISFEFQFKELPESYSFRQKYFYEKEEEAIMNFKLNIEVLKKKFKKITIETMDQKFEMFSSNSKDNEPETFVLSINNKPLSLKFTQENGYQFYGNHFLPNIFPYLLKDKVQSNEIRSRQLNDIFINYINEEIRNVFINSIGENEFSKLLLQEFSNQQNKEYFNFINNEFENDEDLLTSAKNYFHRLVDEFVSELSLKNINDASERNYNFYYDNPYNLTRRLNSTPFGFEEHLVDEVENVFLKLLKNLPESDQYKINLLIMSTYWSSLIEICNNNLFNYFSRVQYIAPIRASAQRYYRSQGLAVNEIDPQGENIPMAIKNMSTKESKVFRSWTKQNFEFEIFTEKAGGHISLKIKFNNDDEMNLTDTGFGFSQILPIILLIWRSTYSSMNDENYSSNSMSSNNSYTNTIVIEQPELHLHPNLQAKLCEVIVKCVNYYEKNNSKNRTRIIIETHSDTIINKLGQLIYEEELNKDTVNILAFGIPYKEDGVNISIKNIPFDEDGLFEEWPTDFLMEDF